MTERTCWIGQLTNTTPFLHPSHRRALSERVKDTALQEARKIRHRRCPAGASGVDSRPRVE